MIHWWANDNAKFLQICSAEETNSFTSWIVRGWVNFQQIFIFEWIIPLNWPWAKLTVADKWKCMRIPNVEDGTNEMETVCCAVDLWHSVTISGKAAGQREPWGFAREYTVNQYSLLLTDSTNASRSSERDECSVCLCSRRKWIKMSSALPTSMYYSALFVLFRRSLFLRDGGFSVSKWNL